MHVETMARNESLHKQLETKEASIAILKKSKKKNAKASDEGGTSTNKRADIIDSKRGISGVNNPTTQRVITSHKTSRHNDNTTDYHCFNRSFYPEEEEEGQELIAPKVIATFPCITTTPNGNSTLTGSTTGIVFQMMPVYIHIKPCLDLDSVSTIGWDSFAGISVSDQEPNFLYLITDGPLMQSNIVLEGLGGTEMKPVAEGPLLVQCRDPITQVLHWKVDPHGLYVPKGKVQVFSTTKMARYGEGLKCNHNGIGNNAIVNHFTGDALNCRDKGDVISNKTAPYNKTSVRLPQRILRVLNTELPLFQLLAINKNEAREIKKTFAVSASSPCPLQVVLQRREEKQVATQTSDDDVMY